MAIARSLRPPQLALNPTRAPRSWVDALGSTIMGIAVIGSAAYGLYWVFKTYVEPRLIVSGPGPLERSIIELVAVVRQMGEDRRAAEIRADEQNARVIQLLNDLRQDVTSLKGVLVARSQFPAPPVTASIPSWQRSHATSIETTPINTNKTSTSAPSATSSVAPATEEMVNGTINGKLAENDAKQVIFASNESTVSSSNGDHKENVTENSQQLQQNKPNLNDSIKAKSQRPKSKKADLEV
ncbi:peroxisomal membrane protein PEX14-like [Tropilaelaps mercedesae]|uniref:Peroxisomal membrane protein PEX14-like n=1 Tax=Tropilaelaps mercedesae TaxID=418985 RepID=A0A1V9XX44_9ACAR|nr:peroxisomal membrane protein PEX14-like [Tropilaelaps mercedesae]